MFKIWNSASRFATERSLERWHNDFNLLIRRASAQNPILRRAIALERARNSAHHGKIFCADEFFLQKRVAQFRQLRTTNHQVTSVFTHFKFQLVNTRTLTQSKRECELPELPRIGSEFSWVMCGREMVCRSQLSPVPFYGGVSCGQEEEVG